MIIKNSIQHKTIFKETIKFDSYHQHIIIKVININTLQIR